MEWQRDPLEALEELSFNATADIPSNGPTFSRPTLRAHFGVIPENILGLYGTPQRRTLELELLTAFLQMFSRFIVSSAPVRSGQEGGQNSQHDFLFGRDTDSSVQRQTLRDQGGVYTPSASHGDQGVWLPLRDGPGRMPTSLTKVVISNLPAEFMIPGVTKSLLESAGYTVTDDPGTANVAIRAEHGGEQKPEVSARFPHICRLGIVIAVLKAPTEDPGLTHLPRKLADQNRVITIEVTGHRIKSQPLPGFVPARTPAQPTPGNALRTAHQQPLDVHTDLRGRAPRDRRGLGRPEEDAQRAIVPTHAGPSAMEIEIERPAPPSEPERMEIDHTEDRLRPSNQPLLLLPAPPSLQQTIHEAPPPPPELPPPPPQTAPNEGLPSATFADYDPLTEILETAIAPAPPQRYPEGPLAECLLDWAQDENIARDYNEAADMVAHFYDVQPSLWEAYAQDTSRPPASNVRFQFAKSTYQDRAYREGDTIDRNSAPPSENSQAVPSRLPRPPAVPSRPPNPPADPGRPHANQTVRRTQRRSEGPPSSQRSADHPRRSNPSRTRNRKPWYHPERLQQSQQSPPPGFRPRGGSQ